MAQLVPVAQLVTPWLVAAALGAALMLAHAPGALVTLGLDGMPVLALLAAAAGFGVWPADRLLAERRAGLRLACLAAALGLGIIGLATLALGLAGALSQVAAGAMLAAGIAAGAVWLRAHRGRIEFPPPGSASPPGPRRPVAQQAPAGVQRTVTVVQRAVAGLLLAVPAFALLYAASLPPGLLWSSEARGYDALEYHLQAPREYFDAGRIEFLPHNVYASFPQQVEMLYLLLMRLLGGPYDAAVPAQLLHAALAGLGALAIAAWTRPGLPRLAALVAAATTPWLAIVGSLAYVEAGVLFFAAVAAGLALQSVAPAAHIDSRAGAATGPAEPATGPAEPATGDAEPAATHAGDPRRAGRLMLAAGLCAGLAGGSKYTAMALVTVGLGLAWLLVARCPLRRRLGLLAIYAAAAAAVTGPWLARNAAFTGNPVYPFAFEWFGGRAWSQEQARQWARGHAVADGGASARARIALRELLADAGRGRPQATFFAGLVPLAVLAAVWARGRRAAGLAIWAGLMLAAWALLTHMPGRFLVPLIAPAALLIGCAVSRAGPRGRAALAALVLAGAVLGDVRLMRELGQERRWWARQDIDLGSLSGQAHLMASDQSEPLNGLRPGGRIWLVGEAAVFYITQPIRYTVVFNRDPWVQFVERNPDPTAAVEWLQQHGVSHVLFNWPEIERLRATYGFSPAITRDWVAGLVREGLVVPAPRWEPAQFGRLLYVVPPAESRPDE